MNALTAQENYVKAAALSEPSAPIVGCGWGVSRALDYALPQEHKVQGVLLLLQKSLHAQGYTDADDIKPKPAAGGVEEIRLSAPLKFRLAMHKGEWAFGRAFGLCPIAGYLDKVCSASEFSEGLYSIARCTISSVPADVARAAFRQASPSRLHLSGTPP